MSWTSPVIEKLYSNDTDINPFGRPINPDEESWIGSLINIGAMIGPFPYGFLSARFGRKVSLLCVAIPHTISYLIFAFSKTIHLYYFARILGGIALGGGYTILPMYVAEVTEDSNRGMYSSTLNIFWTFGNLVPYVIGPYTRILWFNVILACVSSLFFILFFLVAPESPYYLTMKNETSKTETVLMNLRCNDKKAVEHEILYIQRELKRNSKAITFAGFLRTKTYMKGLFISVALVVFQQLSGVNAILFYTEDIFNVAATSSLKPEVSAMITAFIVFLSSFGTPFVVDRLGRRMLLQVSLLGVSVSHCALGSYFYLEKSTDVDVSAVSWVPMASLVAYNVMFAVGIGPLPWTVSSELFPTSVKSYAASLVSFSCWLASFVITKFFNDLQNAIGVGATFWSFGVASVFALVFTFVFVPETKGKSFQDIQEILQGWGAF